MSSRKNKNVRSMTKVAGKSFGITFPIEAGRLALVQWRSSSDSFGNSSNQGFGLEAQTKINC